MVSGARPGPNYAVLVQYYHVSVLADHSKRFLAIYRLFIDESTSGRVSGILQDQISLPSANDCCTAVYGLSGLFIYYAEVMRAVPARAAAMTAAVVQAAVAVVAPSHKDMCRIGRNQMK